MSAAHDLRRFTAEQYLQMFAVGIFTEADHIELVDGEILNVAPQGPEHRSLKDELRRRLEEAYLELDVYLQDQGPLLAGDRGVPEPDLAVVRGRPRDYMAQHPRGRDTILLVEIAKTTQERDRAKARDYARGAAPVYWLLDLEARTLDVYTDPRPETGRYHAQATLTETDRVVLPKLDVSWLVSSLLA